MAVRRFAPLAIAAAAVAIAWAFAATTLARGERMGLPLDDSYAYLTYARQLARGHLSVGAPSLAWPVLLAPFSALGVWAAFALCAALYAATAIGCYRFVRAVAGEVVGLLAAALVLATGWTALAGLETALASALVMATLVQLAGERRGPLLGVTIAALGLVGVAAAALAAAICIACAAQRAWRREPIAAVWWLAPLAAPAAWLVIARPPLTALALLDAPLVWPRVVVAVYAVGAVRLARWAWREKRALAGAIAIIAPVVAPPAAMLVAACAIAPPRQTRQRAWLVAACIAVAVFACAAEPGIVAGAYAFADSAGRGARIGEYVRDKLPGARVMADEPGAIAYYADTRVDDFREVAGQGPGARFEYLESLPADRRPDLFAVVPARMGIADFFGEVLVYGDIELIRASWDHVGTGERPVNDHTGWSIVDRVDVADLASERAHAWSSRAASGTLVEREVGGQGLVIDGGRTIYDGETFTIALDPQKAARVVIRTGGQPGYLQHHELIAKPIELRLLAGKRELGKLTVAPPAGVFSELAFVLPPRTLREREVELRTSATGPYRVFHWFVLQPE